MTGTGAGIEPGDTLPFAAGMDSRQRYWSFEDQAGRPAALILAGAAHPSAVMPLAEAFSAQAGAFAALGADVRLLAQACAPGWATAAAPAGVDLVHLVQAELFRAAGEGPAVVVSDRAMRLVLRLDARPGAVDAALQAIAALSGESSREVVAPAPVLIVPGLFGPDLRARLIARFEGGDHRDGAMASVDAEGRPVNRLDPAKKHRRDLELDAGEPLQAEVVAVLSTRLVPQIARAFQARVAHLDRLILARYDDTGGWFRRHRDNSSAHLGYREWALSVNLNTGAYAGGELLFPEFNDHRHNPPAGAGLVFSAGLLHEAAPVTRGSRYVLLTFLHGDAAEARRRAALEPAPELRPEPA